MKSIAKRIYVALIILFLYAPIGILMVLSFNESKIRAKCGGFTLKLFIALVQNEEFLMALFNT
ncbi:MAG: ABC transporter permease, partial [Lachnospiraceae bacterium]|nr:ABC transporter permease [Lachnospiraceae bacterium]